MSSSAFSVNQQIKDHALSEIGIDVIGICDASKLIEAEKQLQEFLDNGYHGEMHYLENPALRTDPQLLLPGAQSVIVIAINYYREKPFTPADRGRVARYAWGRDYHKVLKKVLKQLQAYLDKNWPEHVHKLCVDSAPLMEKAFAEKAGIGFYGKNTTLINPQIGSFFLLGEIITTLKIEPDSKSDAIKNATCGTCTRCLEACPTQALIAPGKMDARRCISYLTIESKEAIPAEFSRATDNLIMGCDICQEVCPYNKSFAKPLKLEALKSVKIAGDSLSLEEILQIKSTDEFLARFAGSPLTRPKREGLIKNSINAAINAVRQDPTRYRQKFLPILENLSAHDTSEKIRKIAQDALIEIAKI